MDDWISVRDRLPKEHEWVLISFVDENKPNLRFVPSVGMYHNCRWSTKESDEYFSNSDRVYSKNDYEATFRVKVTHWMPLPNAPK